MLDRWQGVGQPANVSAVGQVESVQLFTPKVARSPDGRIWFVTGDGFVARGSRAHSGQCRPAAGARRAGRQRRQAVRAARRTALAALAARPQDRLHRAQLHGARAGAVPLSARRPRYRVAGRGQPARGLLHGPLAWSLPLSGDRREQQRDLERSGRHAGIFDRPGLVAGRVPFAWRAPLRSCWRCTRSIGCAWRVSRVSSTCRSTRASTSGCALRATFTTPCCKASRGSCCGCRRHCSCGRAANRASILEESIDQAADAITEGRDAVQGLRASIGETQDLGEAIRSFGATLATDASAGSPSRSAWKCWAGRARCIRSFATTSFASPARRCAMPSAMHSRPGSRSNSAIDERELRVRVRDDGKGMATRHRADGAATAISGYAACASAPS